MNTPTKNLSRLTALVAVSLLGFVGTVTVGRFVERRGGR